MRKLLWDVRHREFSLSDHYYFSKLATYLKEWGINFEEREEQLAFKFLSAFDILVLCYPEEPFSPREKADIKRFMEAGGRVIVTAYYRCSDRVAGICNTLTEEWGIKFRDDEVIDPLHCMDNDPLLITTSKFSPGLKGVSQIFFPCSASLEIGEEVEVLILGEESALSDIAGSNIILGASRSIGKGELIALGTSVFWDNFAIEKLDNLKLCEYLFRSIGPER